MDPVWQWMIWFLFHRVTRYVFAWVVCAATLYLNAVYAWEIFDDSRRADGNSGHTTIDFGGQWLMGAMLIQGDGQHLYNRNYQWHTLQSAMPYKDEVPDEKRPAHNPADSDQEKGKRDPDKLMTWLMGSDSPAAAKTTTGSFLTPLAAPDSLTAAALLTAGQEEWTPERLNVVTQPRLGGPLYPPVNALYLAPLAGFRPQTAYRINQFLCLVWVLVAGLGVSYLTRRNFWWPVAATLIAVYPGFKGALHLGQNAPLTLAILIWGWALLARGHPIWGGIVWGFFAFKPVWAASFFFVPLLTGRPRFCLAMLGTGAVLGLATLPFVGIHSWFDWLAVGREAAALYNTDQNWIFLSRDLLGIPRRWMLDFSTPGIKRDRVRAAIAGWTMWAVVLEITLLVVALRPKQLRETTGPVPAFLFLAAWLLCYHFMYYDSLLSVLPIFLLCAEPRRFLEPIFVALVPMSATRLDADLISYYRPGLPEEYPAPVPLLSAGHRNLLVVNRMVPTVLVLLLLVEHMFTPLDLGASVTGYWSARPHEATIQWEEPIETDPDIKKTVTATGKWAEQPIKISSSIYADGHPWDTYVLIFLWLWCGGLWLLRSGPAPAKFEMVPESVTDVILVPLEETPSPAIRPA